MLTFGVHAKLEVYLDLWFGELAENLPQLGDFYQGEIDAWFLDGFSPDKNPEMWQENLYQQMFRLSRNGGTFATFTAASNLTYSNVKDSVKKEKCCGGRSY